MLFCIFQTEDFTEQPGPNLPDGFDPVTASPIDYFWLLFPIQLIEVLVGFTNRYAAWKQHREGPDPYWEDVTVPELRAFLGINILMGVNELPETDMYWSSDPLIGNAGIQKLMTCNRFQKIMQYFHASDREAEPVRGDPAYDQLYKIRDVMNSVLIRRSVP